jgi:hypothetical protein
MFIHHYSPIDNIFNLVKKQYFNYIKNISKTEQNIIRIVQKTIQYCKDNTEEKELRYRIIF